jgi:hypothetical protein
MPGAQAMRLISALEDFIRSYQGDTGNPGAGRLRGQVDPHAAELVRDAEQLHTKLTGTYGAGGAERNTPGSRAAQAAGMGDGSSPATRGRQLASAMTRPGG